MAGGAGEGPAGRGTGKGSAGSAGGAGGGTGSAGAKEGGRGQSPDRPACAGRRRAPTAGGACQPSSCPRTSAGSSSTTL